MRVSGTFMVSSFLLKEIEAPMCSKSSDIHFTSAIIGTLRRVNVPGASRQAAISFRAEFFAPDTVTDPCRGPDFSTRIGVFSERVSLFTY